MTQIIDLGKLRFNFAGQWLNTTEYEANDVVKYGGNVYVYIYGLKASATLPTDTVYWALMVEGFKFKGVYSSATTYHIGDGVAHGGKVYACILDNTNATPPNATYWSQFSDGIQYEGTYSGAAAYQKNDVVVYGGSAYIAKQDTTNNLPTASAFWDKFVEGVSSKAIYNSATTYVPDDIVAYGANLYRAIAGTLANVPTNTSYWSLYLSGVAFKGVWTTATAYGIGEVVSYGGNTYIALIQHASTTFAVDLAANKWLKYNSGIRYRGAWLISQTYLPDDVVTSDGSTYITTTLTTGGSAPSLGTNINFSLFAAAGIDGIDGSVVGLNKTGDSMTGPLIITTIAGSSGATINEFSTDKQFSDASDSAVPTEKATKAYMDKIQFNVYLNSIM